MLLGGQGSDHLSGADDNDSNDFILVYCDDYRLRSDPYLVSARFFNFILLNLMHNLILLVYL